MEKAAIAQREKKENRVASRGRRAGRIQNLNCKRATGKVVKAARRAAIARREKKASSHLK